jgi:two-component system sensor histidine kinase HydH
MLDQPRALTELHSSVSDGMHQSISNLQSISTLQEDAMGRESVVVLARLSASLIHDLRNPLTAISAGTELLMDMDLPCPHSRRLASNIYYAARRIEQLFEDLVYVSRGYREPLQDCKLVDVLQSAFEHVANAAAAQGVFVEIAAPDWMQLSMQRKCMERVFVNIMNNALESMPAGGQLRIIAKNDRSDLIIKIDDTGSRVPDQLHSKLFKPFVSGGKENGIGLGLILSRQIVIDHGGDLWLEEKAGPGTLFYVRLPLESAISSRAPLSDDLVPDASRSRGHAA